LLGVDDEEADFSVMDPMNKKSMSADRRRLRKKNAKRNDFRLQELQSGQSKTPKNSAGRGSSKVKDKKVCMLISQCHLYQVAQSTQKLYRL
jgi:G patch domain-containing protein 2